MRVLLISPVPPLPDGLSSYAAGVAQAYRERGHEVAAVVPAPADGPVAVLGSLGPSPRRWLRSWRAATAWRPDVVHVQHTIAAYGPRVLALWTLVAALRLGGARVVVTHHEVTRDLSRLGLPGRVYYRVTCRLAATAHVHTRAAANALLGLGVATDRILVRPHPVIAPPRASVTPAQLRDRHALGDLPVLLLFGFVHVEKGILETVRALGALRRARGDLAETVRLVVAGAVRPRPAGFARFQAADEAYLAAVHRAVVEEGLGEVVRFVGAVPDTEVAAWFRACDLVLLPYVAIEQSGVAHLAVGCDAPVLATDVGGLAELFGGALPALPDLAPEPFAAAVAAALDDLPGRSAAARRRHAEIRADASPERLVDAVVAHLGGTDRQEALR